MAFEYSLRFLRNRRLRGRSEPTHPAPFIVGVGRSGTTLLRMMLDAHPELAIPPETHFANPLIQASGRLRFSPEIATRTIVDDERRRWRDFGLDEDELLARFQALEQFNTSDALRAFYELYAAKHGKPRWGDKTPDYVRKMKKLQKTLPEARFIHVIRDGRDAGLSQNARIAQRGKDPVPPREMARRWRKRIVKSREDAIAVEHYIEVRYEDLVVETETVLRRICEHVELDYDPALLSYHERAAERLEEMAGALPAKKGRPEREAGERVEAHALTTKPPQSDRVAVWKREMSEAENAEFEETAGHLLDELGYETVTPRESWTAPEEWANSKARSERGEGLSTKIGTRIPFLNRNGADRGRAPVPFVVGMNRSGTTLLRMMLDAHPELTIPPETHFVPDLIKAVREDGATPEDALTAMKSAREWGDFGFSDEEMLARLRALPKLAPGPAVRTFYEAYMEQQGKSRWGEKTPTYVQKMKLIQRALPEARFVHVIRDGRDVALSVLDRTVRELTAADVAGRWRKKVSKAREDSPQLRHYTEIRYEDLILDTEPVLRRVCEFIELPWEDSMLTYHERSGERLQEMARALPGDGRAKELSVERRMATHAMTTKPPSADRVARWRTQMSAEQRAQFEDVAGDLLAELGYPVGDDAVERATAQIEAAA